MSMIIGIDLGTTNSLVACMMNGRPMVIPGDDGDSLLPSVVTLGHEQSTTVGRKAKEEWIATAGRTVFSIKRFMGKGMDDVMDELDLIPFKVSGEGRELLRVQVGERLFTPPEISALILRELKRRAEAYLGTSVERAVITVPAYFNESQRQATKDAGRIAGLEVLRIINEPTAASLAYGLHERKEGTIAVYDFGGGTFDISILKLRDGIFEVLSTSGNTHLGGDDIDQLMAEMVLSEIRERFDQDIGRDLPSLQRIREACEAIKRILSDETMATLEIGLPDRGIHYERRLTRDEFERAIRKVVEKTLQPCRMALKDAGLDPARDVDEVVLVGGSTRIPLVRRMVEQLFKRPPISHLNPHEVVALGAAIQADILAGGTRDMLLLDVTPLSLGIETFGGTMGPLIPRNSSIPASVTETFTTSVDGQTSVEIHVLQGERDLAEDNRSLARFQLKGIEPTPAGMPRIEVRFLIDADGILNVTARDVRSGKQQSVEVKPTYGLTDEEVERMLRASLEHAEEDVKARFLIESRNEADIVIKATEKSLSNGEDLISGEERRGIERALDDLKRALNGDDYTLIRERTDALNEATQNLARLTVEAAIGRALKDQKVTDLLK